MTILSTFRTMFRRPQRVTCADAGRFGYLVRHEKERAKIRATTRALALSIGRPDLAERINDPLDAGPCSHPANQTARAGFGSSAPLSLGIDA